LAALAERFVDIVGTFEKYLDGAKNLPNHLRRRHRLSHRQNRELALASLVELIDSRTTALVLIAEVHLVLRLHHHCRHQK
jgi:hypothetical protein